MNKEIETLINNLEGCVGMFDYMLTPIENDLLLSYINELQQENKELKTQLQGVREERAYLFNKLSIENKYLQQENKELHNKIDKAIGYIEKCSLGEDYYGNPVMLAKEDEGKDLLEILKDSDVDE